MRYLPVQLICGLSLTDFDRIRESFSTQRSFKCASQRELTSYCSVAIEIPFPGSVFFVCHWEKVKIIGNEMDRIIIIDGNHRRQGFIIVKDTCLTHSPWHIEILRADCVFGSVQYLYF